MARATLPAQLARRAQRREHLDQEDRRHRELHRLPGQRQDAYRGETVKDFARSGRCVTKRPAGQTHAKRCTLCRLMGSFRHTDKAYRLEAMPTFAGRSGAARTAGFQIVR